MAQFYTREEIALSVCQLRQPLPNGKVYRGTGFFLVDEPGLYLVSASHVASKLGANAEVVVSDASSRPVTLAWRCLVGSDGVPNWKSHSEADLSVLALAPDQGTLNNHLKGRFLPFKLLPTAKEPPNRDVILTSVGFPLGLGTSGYFSPLTFESKASSGFLTLKRADTHTPCTFFILQNPTIGGYSGCPVFDVSIMRLGAMTTTGSGTLCHGITHGTLSDETGGKLAAVTPSYYIHDLIGV